MSVAGKYPEPTAQQARALYIQAAQSQFAAWIAGWRELSKMYRQQPDHERADAALQMAHWFEYAQELAVREHDESLDHRGGR